MTSTRLLVGPALLCCFAVAACGESKNPELNEAWDVGECVTAGGNSDIDPADCDGENDGKIVKVIGPFGTGTCPAGTRSVNEIMIGGNGEIRQEMRICLSDPSDS
jgi:hypothetical protein